jgi:predicted transcriptional regulator
VRVGLRSTVIAGYSVGREKTGRMSVVRRMTASSIATPHAKGRQARSKAMGTMRLVRDQILSDQMDAREEMCS